MKFFNPLLWYNRIDPSFDFNLDRTTSELSRKERTSSYVCGYEFFEEKLCDGLLVSRSVLNYAVNVKKPRKRYKIVTPTKSYSDIQTYARVRPDLNYLLFADPGTWSYVNCFELPDYLYNQDDLIDYYRDMGFHLAGSVDWPILDRITVVDDGKKKRVDLDNKTKEYRRQVTLDLAGEFLKCYNKRSDVSFLPFGTIQGYSVDTYLDSFRKVLKMGYSYIAVGGLGGFQSTGSERQVLELLPILWTEARKSGTRPGIHIYGRFPSPSAVGEFLKNGVTSFDSNFSFTETRIGKHPYWDPDFIWNDKLDSPISVCYRVRIPATSCGGRSILKRAREKSEEEFRTLSKVCDDTFKAFCVYVNSDTNSDLRTFLCLYEKMTYCLNEYRVGRYDDRELKSDVEICERTMKSKVWLKCGCSACRELGCHVVLARRLVRAAYAFCHNTYVQYSRFRRVLERAKREVEYDQYDWFKIEVHKSLLVKMDVHKGGL